MRSLSPRQMISITIFGAVGWALCGAIMFIGMEVTSMQTTLIAHALGAPVIFAVVSWIYYTRFGYTKPLTTPAVFVGIVILLDIFPVARVLPKTP